MTLNWYADVAVLGGGPAGVVAALAAAEEGSKVILIEKYGFMGGMATAGMLGSICGFYHQKETQPIQIIGGLANRLKNKLAEYDGLGMISEVFGRTYVIPYDIQAFKFACDDLINEFGIQLILHAWATSVEVQDRLINSVYVQTKEGIGKLDAKAFIDATGDGDIAAYAGAEYTLNPKQLQFPSTLFSLANVKVEESKNLSSQQFASLVLEARKKGYRLPRVTGSVRNLPHSGLVRLNVTLIKKGNDMINGVNHSDLTFAEVEGRKQIREYFRFLKNNVPGFSDSYIAEIAPQTGIRETRKIIGEYILKEEDIFKNFLPEDIISLNAWPVELHSSSGTTNWEFIDGIGFHGIPFRCLQPLELKNLLVVGRCISATHRALSSVRVMGPAMAMGEAAGVATSMMVKNNINDSRLLNIKDLQNKLINRGAILGF